MRKRRECAAFENPRSGRGRLPCTGGFVVAGPSADEPRCHQPSPRPLNCRLEDGCRIRVVRGRHRSCGTHRPPVGRSTRSIVTRDGRSRRRAPPSIRLATSITCFGATARPARRAGVQQCDGSAASAATVSPLHRSLAAHTRHRRGDWRAGQPTPASGTDYGACRADRAARRYPPRFASVGQPGCTGRPVWRVLDIAKPVRPSPPASGPISR